MQEYSKQEWTGVIASLAPRIMTVGNIDIESTTEEDVLSFSTPYGTVDDVQFWRSKRQGRSFVFITYSTKRQAAAAVSQLSSYDTIFTGSDGRRLQFHERPVVQHALVNSLHGNYDKDTAYRLISESHSPRASLASALNTSYTEFGGSSHDDDQAAGSGSSPSKGIRHAGSLEQRLNIKPDPEAVDAFIASAVGTSDLSLSPPVSETIVATSPRSIAYSSVALPSTTPIVPAAMLPSNVPSAPAAMRNRLGSFAHPTLDNRRSSEIGAITSLGGEIGEKVVNKDWECMCKQAELGVIEFKKKWQEAELQTKELKEALDKAQQLQTQTTDAVVLPPMPIDAQQEIPKLQEALALEAKNRHMLGMELNAETLKRKRADDMLAETEEDVRRLRHQLENEHRLHLEDLDAVRRKETARSTAREERLLAEIDQLRRQVVSQGRVASNLDAELTRNREWRAELRQELKEIRESKDAIIKERDAALQKEEVLTREIQRLHAVVDVAKHIDELVAKVKQRVAGSKANDSAIREVSSVPDLLQ
ncbi:hypothetical protein FRB94_003608 [Tulasnella sp. JGI-2019a]|nr:hypothetical protein FRB94_003608 [Tulasnella sp. JGI-2019a]